MELEEYQGHLRQAALLVGLVRMIPVTKMLGMISWAETTGPMLDPTLYREKAQAMKEDAELLEALLPMYALAVKIKPSAEGEGE